MKYLIKLFFTILLLNIFHNVALAADKYVGSGDLKLDDPDVKWFLEYLKAPAGQIPMTFFVLSENGKAIWSTYWYCPEGNCQTLSKKNASQKCNLGAEKYYKRSIFEECKVFAQRRTIVWRNGINPGRGKVSRASSKWDEKKLRAKLTELGFLGDNASSNNSTNNKKKKKNDTSKMSNEDIQHLKDLKKLLDEGILNQEEFDTQKKKILN